MRTRCLGGFSVMWVPKLLLSPVKIRIFLPKNDKIWPEIGIFGGLVGGCGARAESRKTSFTLSKLSLPF